MYTKGQSIEFIEKAFGSSISSNQGLNVSVTCPICLERKNFTKREYKKRKLVIRTDNFLCHCWVCGYKSRNLISLLKKYYPHLLSEYLETFIGKKILIDNNENIGNNNCLNHNNNIKLPEDFLPLLPNILLKENYTTIKDYLKYLEKRLGSNFEELVEYWGLGFSQKDLALRERIIIPSFNVEGDLNYYTARTIRNNIYPKYINPHLPREDIIFNEINIDWKKPLLITEGPFDLIASKFPNGTCLLGSTINSDFLLFAKIVKYQTPIILALDRDAKQKEMKIAKLFHSYGITITYVSIPEPWNDVAEMPHEVFKYILAHAKLYSTTTELLNRINNINI